MTVLQVDIVVPVRNEERDLAPSVRRLAGYLRERFPFSARITIADNGSTDDLSTDLNALLPLVARLRPHPADVVAHSLAERDVAARILGNGRPCLSPSSPA
jgi:hypothetical protein